MQNDWFFKPKTTSIIRGDLTKIPLGTHDYLVHQCNCKTTHGLGLSATLFEAHPHADIYGDGSRRIPGEIIVRKPVINLLGQFYPGPPRYSNDSTTKRKAWFKQGLDKISSSGIEIKNLYFPYKIGCGLAKGCWRIYSGMLEDWAKVQPFNVVIVRL